MSLSQGRIQEFCTWDADVVTSIRPQSVSPFALRRGFPCHGYETASHFNRGLGIFSREIFKLWRRRIWIIAHLWGNNGVSIMWALCVHCVSIVWALSKARDMNRLMFWNWTGVTNVELSRCEQAHAVMDQSFESFVFCCTWHYCIAWLNINACRQRECG